MPGALTSLPPIACPFPSLVHPSVDRAEAHVREFGRRFGLVKTQTAESSHRSRLTKTSHQDPVMSLNEMISYWLRPYQWAP